MRRLVSKNSIISGQKRVLMETRGPIEVLRVEIGKLSLSVGDILVASVGSLINAQQAAALRQDLLKIMPPGVLVMVKNDEVELSVIEKEHGEVNEMRCAGGDSSSKSVVVAMRAKKPACIEQGVAA